MRRVWAWCLVVCLPVLTGCASTRPGGFVKSRAPKGAIENPVFVSCNDEEWLWESVVDVTHDYFRIARENRLEGMIETEPKVAAGILEPWHRDSVGARNRLEASLQSQRRRGFVSIHPDQGGYWVGIEVLKEQEDVEQAPDHSAGGATFQDSRPLQRDLTLVVGEAPPAGWIPLGRDADLEQKFLTRLRKQLTRR